MINIQNIDFAYKGSKHAVFNNFTLQLEPGNICGLLGKNGTGKSTLLYLLTGLLCPSKGSILVNETEAGLRRPEMLREVYLVPEEIMLPDLTFQQFCKLHTDYYPRFSQEVLNKCFNDFEVEPGNKFSALSMGQKKKVFMSFALASGTQYLFMDEPTNGLDIPSKSLFRKVVANNMSDDRLMLVSTHQVHDVEALLDHIVMIDEEGLLVNHSVAEITDKFTFSMQPGGVGHEDDVLYSEPSMGGRLVVKVRKEDEEESQLNLELFFNAIAKGAVRM